MCKVLRFDCEDYEKGTVTSQIVFSCSLVCVQVVSQPASELLG